MYASPPRDRLTGRVIRKKQPALPPDVCRICNRFQYHEDFEAVHASDGFHEPRTEILGEPDSYVIRIHTKDLLRDGKDVEDASRLRNCPYCRLLYDALNLFFKDASLNWVLDARNETARIKVRVNQGAPLILACEDAINHYYQFTHIRGDVEIYSADWGNLAKSDFPIAGLAPPTPTPPTTWTRDKQGAEGFLQYWFRDCACRADAMDQCYNTPNRLLYIDWANDTITLQEFQSRTPGMLDLDRPVEYATLSHCWLDEDPTLPKLLLSNIHLWRRGCKISCLPAGLRDAIRVANLNEIPYIFIDSLCIVQDWQQDRDTQQPMVGFYFRDSILTIVAASSARPDDGFLFPPERDWLTATVDFKAPSGASGTLTMRKKYSRPASPFDAVDEASTLSHVARGSYRRVGPLYARHWCLQEALLGTRVMHFTSAGIMCDCKRHNCSREYVTSYRRAEVFRGLPARQYLRDGLEMWLAAVQFHTSCYRLAGKDRLSAISALAAMSEMGISDRYVAGLWWGGMTMGLLWEVKLRPGQTNTTKITMPYSVQKAPSFSWASVDAPVIFKDNRGWCFESEVVVLEAGSLPKNANDPCGNVDGAFIRLEAYIKKCEVSQILRGATGGHWQFVYFRNKDGTTTKMHPFVGDGPLVEVKGKQAALKQLRKKRAQRRLRKKRQSGSKSGAEGEDDNPNRSHTYLTRNHYEYRREKVGRGKITGVAWVMCVRRRGQDVEEHKGIKMNRFDGLVLTPSMRYPGSYERIGCIRNIPDSLFDPKGECDCS
ncbi:uncharacterized protein TRIREDRAFT_106171 [Trichoderma reesei QM6a]|uniref:Predicted protein n=1 Tax=Hypocrea jecorina (strain QM6a) TaxID=431241 RepID=G0RGI3_HYPJQ|nr:uncharacterized protein TRIREDRAFT_106171 [Trichoderma reesei QM6a]EGR50046.1 predicted protein [Trichoderma reesei QM6a]